MRSHYSIYFFDLLLPTCGNLLYKLLVFTGAVTDQTRRVSRFRVVVHLYSTYTLTLWHTKITLYLAMQVLHLLIFGTSILFKNIFDSFRFDVPSICVHFEIIVQFSCCYFYDDFNSRMIGNLIEG